MKKSIFRTFKETPVPKINKSVPYHDFLWKIYLDNRYVTFQTIFTFTLDSSEKIFFIAVCAILAGVGIIGNLCIIIVNILYRIRFHRESDFYISGEPKRRGKVSFSLNPFKVNITRENRFSYFDALSNQAKFRYSHVIFAVAIFNLVASLIIIPLSVIFVCDLYTSIEDGRVLLVVCSSWSIFQILFISTFFFVNTTIQFLSIVSPLTFTMRRSPLCFTFLFVVAICGMQSFLMLSIASKEIAEILYDFEEELKSEIIERTIAGLRASLIFPILIYLLTWICTIIMYVIIIRHICVAVDNVYKITEITPRSMPCQQSLWQRGVKKNIQKCMILGAGTTVFYLLELPVVITVYLSLISNMWVALSHLTINAITPLMHIMLSKSFRTTLYGVMNSRRRALARLSSIS
ncbi:unnamed protein product [Hymenolepis diminuta]|uniref:G_PROTEIN_RECEP_F1_2 domain-containing protein n=1 Tax=Hymenolepis diminuta TaxID=6216 RepID=A0A0R3S8M6_HYMDI|nr:unnamed protein product [Hymenolepis diminuta]VUZ45166.1 unnamed protein product [Hymenolepis diminuta]